MSITPNLTGAVACVTGASRGAGKGIAEALGAQGATVYVTGRSKEEGDAPLPGTVFATAEAINQAGGRGVPVVCDHANDDEVAALFAEIGNDHQQLDILVNNAACLHDNLTDIGPFWEKPADMVDMLNVGLRSSYIASWHAAPLLLKSQQGLLAFTSSFGGRCYMHGPAYGVQKAGVDKFAQDMAVDFKPHNVAAVSLWMGMLKTARTQREMEREPEKYAGFWDIAESPTFTGKVIAALYQSEQRMDKSGQILISAELAAELGVKDEGDVQPPSHREFLGGPAAANPAVVG